MEYRSCIQIIVYLLEDSCFYFKYPIVKKDDISTLKISKNHHTLLNEH